MSMNIQRITISMPKDLYLQLTTRIKDGNMSQFISRAVEEELIKDTTDPIENIIALRNQLPTISGKKILAAIRKGRT